MLRVGCAVLCCATAAARPPARTPMSLTAVLTGSSACATHVPAPQQDRIGSAAMVSILLRYAPLVLSRLVYQRPCAASETDLCDVASMLLRAAALVQQDHCCSRELLLQPRIVVAAALTRS